MVLFNYFNDVARGIEFIIALGSIVGVFGLIIGLLFTFIGGKRLRWHMLGLIITSIVLISICGLHTGAKYFHIH